MIPLENSESLTYLDKDTDFHGTIKTSKLILEGSLEGEVEATEGIYLKKGSIFKGDITAKNISFDEGSVYNGNLHIGTSKNGNSH